MSSTLGAADEDSLRDLDVPLHTLQKEFDLCTRACNTYERNYFAWAHRYRCLDAVISMQVAAQSTDPQRTVDLNRILYEESKWCCRWVELNVSDYTAVQYRCNLALATFQIAKTSIAVPPDGFDDVEAVWRHAQSLVESYPNHEALWLYLRSALKMRLMASDAQSSSIRDEAEALARRHNSRQAEDCEGAVHRNASQFLSWLQRTA